MSVTSTLQFWGAEANAVAVLLPRQGGLEITALAGFRYADLRETLNISTLSSDILTSPQTVLAQSDSFNTRNQFYGAQLGGRVNWQGDLFGVDLTGKLAFGATHQTIDIQGYSTQTGPGGINGTFPGGFFTQTSNIGHYSANRFTVIPALEVKVYMFLTLAITRPSPAMDYALEPGRAPRQPDRSQHQPDAKAAVYGATAS